MADQSQTIASPAINSQVKPTSRSELAIRAVTSLLAFISVVLFGVTIHQSKAEYGGNDWTDGFPIGPVSDPQQGVCLTQSYEAL